MDTRVLAATRMIAKNLTTDELSALYLTVTAGFDVRHVMGYEKAKALFSEANGTKMHSETLEAFDLIVNERMGTQGAP